MYWNQFLFPQVLVIPVFMTKNQKYKVCDKKQLLVHIHTGTVFSYRYIDLNYFLTTFDYIYTII